MSQLLDAALQYAADGWPVFPCQPLGKAPAGALVRHGFQDATTDVDVLRTWWRTIPDANVAVPTGSSTVDVLDVDVRPDGNGWEAFHRAGDAGFLGGALAVVDTPSGGLHLHFPGSDQRSALRVRHLDFKGAGGYVLLPPSRVRTATYDGTYSWREHRRHAQRPEFRRLDVASLVMHLAPPSPPRLHAPLRAHSQAPQGNASRLASWMGQQSAGGRNNALFWAACASLEAGADDLSELEQAALSTGLHHREVRLTLASAHTRVHGKAS